jgi:hypothetical protein
MLSRVLACFCLLVLWYFAAAAQSNPPRNPIVGADRSGPGPDSSIMTGTPEAEMKARRDIKFLEKERRENLERAREAAQLGSEIRESYLKNQALSRTEIKKLERLEKLTRRIREEAGGSDSDVVIENPPRQLEAAVGRMAEISEEVRKGVEKTPRQVVSASVIEHTNELLEIIRFARAFVRQLDQSAK